MTTEEKIKTILAQDNYKIEGFNILRWNVIAEEWKPVFKQNSGLIQLIKDGEKPQMFNYATVLNILLDVNKSKPSKEKKKISPKLKKKGSIKAINQSRAILRDKEIKFIRERLSKGASTMSMAKELGVERFPVMYIVKQIKAGKKLKYEL